MRTILRDNFLNFVGGIVKPKAGVYILNGHFLSRDCHNAPEIAHKFLRELRKYAEFMKIEDAVNLIKTGKCHDYDGVAIAFTFDDGFYDCYSTITPALEIHGTNACFFINPNYVTGDKNYIDNFNNNIVLTPNKKPMDWNNLEELIERGFIIGNHTTDHIRLNIDDGIIISKQILGSKTLIEEHLNIDCNYFAWPYGMNEDISPTALKVALDNHSFVFSGTDYQYYQSFNGSVINRRHFELDWPINHLKYFLSKGKM